MIHRRRFIQATAAFSALAISPFGIPRSFAEPAGAITPEMFGARGDGQTDDSAAFAALAEHVNASGGGHITLRNTTYLVGIQQRDARGRIRPAKLMAFSLCSKPLTIDGNGAHLLCASKQRYGVFDTNGDPADKPKHRTKEWRKTHQVLAPYRDMVSVEHCSGSIEIMDLELDGNVHNLVVGGKHGDKGWQIPGRGLTLADNTGDETLRNVHSHHQPLDGFYIDGPDYGTPSARRRLISINAEYNGRQGMSIVGGHDYEISESRFVHTGRAGLASAPGAGVDIEAERNKWIRNLSFSKCLFEDNQGVGMIADSGKSTDVQFSNCSFVGTTSWCAWPKKPNYRFTKCLFVGSLVNAYGHPVPEHAAQFSDCRFRDDPALSSTGRVYLHHDLIADLPHAKNVLFNNCNFNLTHNGVLPWSTDSIYKNCIMSQQSKKTAHTRGKFIGTNHINGPVNISHSDVKGELFLNGKIIRQQRKR